MVHMRSWTAPPTRREVTLVLFSLTIFVLSYNLETSLGLVGVHPQKLTTTYLSSIGLASSDPGYDADGRRPAAWRDELEDMIAGDWEWREGEVSGDARGHAVSSGSGRYGMIYDFASGRKAGRKSDKSDQGVGLSSGVTAREQFVRWGKDVPQTSVVAHTPGFTILDNVVSLNGTLFMVSKDWTKLPKLGAIASSSLDSFRPPRVQDLHVLTPGDASQWFGASALKIHGTSWLALDTAEQQDPYTLLSLFRTHASLMSSAPSSSFTSTSGLHIISPSTPAAPASSVPAPLRLICPHIPTFSSPHIPLPPGEDSKAHPAPRERAYYGMHPLLPKAVLPALGVWFEEDWQDLADMHVPILLERVVIADRGAAERGRASWVPGTTVDTHLGTNKHPGENGEPAWAAPFVGLAAPETWWTPVRMALLRYLRLTEELLAAHGHGPTHKKGNRKPVVTYISMQEQPALAGPRLAPHEHEKLVEGLRKLERDGVLGEVHVVHGNGSVSALDWEARMAAIARSTIVMGTFGNHLADAVFMRSPLEEVQPQHAPGQKEDAHYHNSALPPMLMEFFPPGTFVRDQQYAMEVLGIDYLAWWNEMRFHPTNLPSVVSQTTTSSNTPIPIDVDAILRAVQDEAPRRAF